MSTAAQNLYRAIFEEAVLEREQLDPHDPDYVAAQARVQDAYDRLTALEATP